MASHVNACHLRVSMRAASVGSPCPTQPSFSSSMMGQGGNGSAPETHYGALVATLPLLLRALISSNHISTASKHVAPLGTHGQPDQEGVC